MEAPLVSLDEEFEDLRPCCSEDPEEKPRCFYGSSPHHLEDPSLSELENFSSEIISFKSMEDLVNEFDEKLNVCFRNYNAKTENLAPVKNQFQIQEEEETLQDEEVWDALTDNYIPSLSEDWRDPNMEAVNGNNSDTEIHEKEEEEFNEKSEHDSGINEEPLLTADQVIEEIEEMMQNSPDPEEEEEVLEEEDGGETSSQADSVLLQEMQALTQTFNNNWSYEGPSGPREPLPWAGGSDPAGRSSPAGLRHMSGSELMELLDQVEGAIRDFSEELVQQLARRDELEFEKEVKNSFITVLIEVQNKQKEQRELMKKRRKEKGLSLQSSRIDKGSQMPLKRFSMEGISNILQSGIRQTFGPSGSDKQYLNTVIPYEKKASPPSVEDLQMLTNILFAMKEDNEKVPTLLTDYILKVLCPT
ncbi:fasciculation and elongation protein zeta-1 isoform X1 [Cervus elaphus]|uniref:fasciculation and elongation protein zeta-1 isoform X1 n=1 Tax=Cervus canadensis TaxID=1574408 RepID=UPI001CA35849|nr:fasciculation and elongation protein zeta-1 isoform X1 [Cervus canadensis]XP_043308455.1 fasciculation and elongation protein zeta-1 isoform X1 [Cervus canadensis]XP_043308456.1 fasciculation and elongation protein zeta-1 isoform X1 [Cervus canadensis]XP_043729766.1 fasciculation and elongation protein zeta-1 isoform X1 [Cervus elaphus]XP_043729775.1 fasciculation and elongation protein zeta-1 isoform X1 [Cervus elaphus]XP_043729782.1 fasciculation and elongation protein zeta-1 isoform X1 [